jgi:hypothetical protein
MIILWLIVYILSHGAHPDHTAVVIQHWEDAHVFLTILIILFLA